MNLKKKKTVIFDFQKMQKSFELLVWNFELN